MKIFLILPPLLRSFNQNGQKINEPLSVGHYMVYRERNVDLGAGYLAAVLEEADHKVKVLDCDIEDCSAKALRCLLKKENPDLVAVSGVTETRFESFAVANISKRILPEVPVVYGGIHATFTAENTLKNIQSIDYIIRGEGETVIQRFAEAIEKGKNIDGVKSLSFRRKNIIIHNPLEQPIQNLNKLPFPARHLFPMKKYDKKFLNMVTKVQSITPFLERSNETVTSIITSRGCPKCCVFCSNSPMWGSSPRQRSATNVLDEVEAVIEEFGITNFSFTDDTFTLNRKHVLSIIKEIKNRRIDITWRCNVRVGTVDKELLKKMFDSGCRYMVFGVESGSQRILEKINKNISIAQIKCFVRLLQKQGIASRAFFMFGLPGETMEDADKTIELISYVKPKVSSIWISFATLIFPGTPLETYAKLNKLLPKNFNWSKPYNNNPELIGYRTTAPVLLQPRMEKKELRAIQEKLFKKDIISYETK